VDALELYRELSFSKKGVCRHRAYAFMITALGVGLPTRLVHNEAHAWVEVFDSEIWHRIDLGGAATNIHETRNDPLLPDHRPPSDPHSWPAGSRSAQEEARGPSFSASPPGAPSSESDAEAPSEQHDGEQSSSPSRAGTSPSQLGREIQDGGDSQREGPVAEVNLRLKESQLLRGHPLAVHGDASRGGRPCALSRVDIFVKDGESWTSIGSVATDRSGEFAGSVTLPQLTPVGPLQVTARLAGGCLGRP